MAREPTTVPPGNPATGARSDPAPEPVTLTAAEIARLEAAGVRPATGDEETRFTLRAGLRDVFIGRRAGDLSVVPGLTEGGVQDLPPVRDRPGAELKRVSGTAEGANVALAVTSEHGWNSATYTDLLGADGESLFFSVYLGPEIVGALPDRGFGMERVYVTARGRDTDTPRLVQSLTVVDGDVSLWHLTLWLDASALAHLRAIFGRPDSVWVEFDIWVAGEDSQFTGIRLLD